MALFCFCVFFFFAFFLSFVFLFSAWFLCIAFLMLSERFSSHHHYPLKYSGKKGYGSLSFLRTFFYFGLTSEEISAEIGSFIECFLEKLKIDSPPGIIDGRTETSGVEHLLMEVISFVELAATCNQITHNLVGSLFTTLITLVIQVLDIMLSALCLLYY